MAVEQILRIICIRLWYHRNLRRQKPIRYVLQSTQGNWMKNQLGTCFRVHKETGWSEEEVRNSAEEFEVRHIYKNTTSSQIRSTPHHVMYLNQGSKVHKRFRTQSLVECSYSNFVSHQFRCVINSQRATSDPTRPDPTRPDPTRRGWVQFGCILRATFTVSFVAIFSFSPWHIEDEYSK
jgi:hypothetical protein